VDDGVGWCFCGWFVCGWCGGWVFFVDGVLLLVEGCCCLLRVVFFDKWCVIYGM